MGDFLFVMVILFGDCDCCVWMGVVVEVGSGGNVDCGVCEGI